MYLSVVRWTDKANQTDFVNTWLPKHDEICEKWGVKFLKHGITFGTVETHVFVYDTDLDLAKYQDFRDEVTSILEGWFDYTKTTIVNCKWG